MADREIELADEASRPERGKSTAKFEELLFQWRQRFARLVMRGAGLFDQARGAALLIATQPFAHGGHGGGEQAGSGLDAALLSALHQSQAMVVGVFHLTYQIEITSGDGHGDQILRAPRRPAPPPSAGRRVHPTASD